jgi:hypothetical protein
VTWLGMGYRNGFALTATAGGSGNEKEGKGQRAERTDPPDPIWSSARNTGSRRG